MEDKMKKIVLLVALIAAGYFIYSENFSQSDNRTRSDKALRVRNMFIKVSSTPVSAQEVKPIFKDSMIDTCEKNGLLTDSSFGTTDECINNFERLASEQCFSQLTDFESKVYSSLDALKVDYLTFYKCAVDIVSDVEYSKTENCSISEKNTTRSDTNLTVKNLFGKVCSTPVSAQEAKAIFKSAIIKTCEVNGVDTINGYGTTAECINNFETFVSEHCFDQLTDFDSKIYTSKPVLRDDFSTFFSCAASMLTGNGSKWGTD